jgi:RNA polymerase sigma factor (sigma-70 family)
LYDVFSVNLTEVYHSPGEHQVENMHQLDYPPYLRDENFIVAIRSGGLKSDHAILGLYTKYHKPVCKTVTEMISLFPGCKSAPQDIVHDAFLVMLHKIQSECQTVSSLKGFWIGIARKIMLNQSKKNGRVTLVEDPRELYGTTDVTPESIFLITERNQLMEDYLSRLGNRCKEILLMWVARYSMEEIAQQLHLSGPRLAAKNKHSCFKKLKEMVIRGNKLAP